MSDRIEAGHPLVFTDLSTDALIAVHDGRDHDFLHALMHLVEHHWLSKAILTWAAMYGRMATPPGITAERAAGGMVTVPVNPDVDLARPWVKTLDILLRSAVYRDGHNVVAATTAAAELPEEQKMPFVMSLVASVNTMLVRSPAASARLVRVMHLYGMSAGTVSHYQAAGLLVDLTMAQCGQEQPVVDEVVGRMWAGGEKQAHALAALATRTLGALSDTDLLVGVRGPDSDPDGPPDLLDWANLDPDPQRHDGELATCWALRMAHSYQHRDPQAVARVLAHGATVTTTGRRRYGPEVAKKAVALAATSAACDLIAAAVLAYEQQLTDDD